MHRSWQTVLAYVYFNLESGQRLALYVGAVKKYKVSTAVAWDAIDGAHINREHFQKYYESIFGKQIDKPILAKLKIAANARNKVVHGQGASTASMREAVGAALDYCELLDGEVNKLVKFPPLKSLKGFVGAMKLRDKPTSRLIMKGLGFPLS